MNREGSRDNWTENDTILNQLVDLADRVEYIPKLDIEFEDWDGPRIYRALRVDSFIKVHFIGHESDVPLLRGLKDATMIGIDTEWRPILRQFSGRDERIAILQLSSDRQAFVIDMIELNQNHLLDETLTSIFTA